ncbi:heavy-metal-associated domain-containing protein [Flavobacterium croceum]|jgi:copper chaperone CopZ|uniref:Copper chaperone CopZ n=1 Tax=Flavobacterium croceum DSM 17960 TaxID=1121886 RepID=A0A2S4N7R6_9FLAO|nr:heavy-metal-associated domain-containing protein [Flavobacterium croceum]POS01738.1 copper chaperone CopZ [Flavobacterium croceum DSM 17960]
MKITLSIQNLKCGGCAKTIETKLANLDNISEIKANPNEDSVTFQYLEEKDLELVKNTLKEIGYPEIGDENSFTTKAKSFVSCAVGKITS